MEIKELTSENSLMPACRLRYEVYVEEMGHCFHEADHDRRLLCEDLDLCSTVFGAFRDGRLVGTARLTCGSSHFGPYAERYGLAERPWCVPEQTAMVTRLVVSQSHRRSRAALELAMRCYRVGLGRGIRNDVIDIQESNERFFRRLGYEPFMEDYEHPVFGLSRPMRLRLTDREHLAQMRSPFLRILDESFARDVACAPPL